MPKSVAPTEKIPKASTICTISIAIGLFPSIHTQTLFVTLVTPVWHGNRKNQGPIWVSAGEVALNQSANQG